MIYTKAYQSVFLTTEPLRPDTNAQTNKHEIRTIGNKPKTYAEYTYKLTPKLERKSDFSRQVIERKPRKR